MESIRIPNFKETVNLSKNFDHEISSGKGTVKLTIFDKSNGKYGFTVCTKGEDCFIYWILVGPTFTYYELDFKMIEYRCYTVYVNEDDLREYVINGTLCIQYVSSSTPCDELGLQVQPDDEYSDVEVHTDFWYDNLHKCLLCQNSPVMETAFKESNAIFIHGCGKEAVGAFLSFFYSGQIECKNEAVRLELWKMAVEYEVADLKVVLQAMPEDICKENCIALLHSAVASNKYYLKYQILNWIRAHESRKILRVNASTLLTLLGDANTADLIEQL